MYPRIIQGTSVPLTDNGPLWCKCQQEPARGKMWKVLGLAVTGTLMDTAISVASPVSGLFIVPVGTPPETINDCNNPSSAFPGVPLNKRFFPIEMECVTQQSGAFPGGGNAGTGFPNFFFSCTLDQKSSIYVPEKFTLLGAYISNPGTAAPGPGAGSQCQLMGFVLEGSPEEFS